MIIIMPKHQAFTIIGDNKKNTVLVKEDAYSKKNSRKLKGVFYLKKAIIIALFLNLTLCQTNAIEQIPETPIVQEIVTETPREIVPSPSREDYSIEFVATAYTHTGNNTAIGVYPRINHTVAVDPSVIPMGSTIYIESDYPGISGYYKVEDTGVHGRTVDIFMDSAAECFEFGRRTVSVTIVNGGE